MAITINLELTDHCNIKCKMCSQSMRSDAHGAAKKFMAFSTWQQSLQNLAGFPEPVHLCPHWLGEPTLHPRFDLFVEYAFAINQHNRLFEKFKLHTNAVQFSKERGRLLLQLSELPFVASDTFNFVHFSIDAFSKPVYKEVKGRDCRQRVYQNIVDFIALRQELGHTYPKITIAFVVQPDNHHEALDFQAFWVDIFAKYNLPLRQFYDWPSEECDNLYFRRLNCADQTTSDALHAKTVFELGLVDQLTNSLKREGSF